jgi:hypothetical protein
MTSGNSLATLTLDELAEAYVSGGEQDQAAIVAEADRRDRRDAPAVRYSQHPWAQADAEWQAAAWAQYEQAQDYCSGYLLNERGERQGGEFVLLWQGGEDRAREFATDELITFWDYVEARVPGPGVFRAMYQAREEDAMDDTTEDVEQASEQPRARHVTTFADITAVEPEWLWEGRIPMGEVTLVVAKGGTGKTFAMTDIAARVTRGDVMPGGAPAGPPGGVVLISGDDDPAAVLAWRLKAAGADLGKVIDYSEPDGAPFRMGGKVSMVPGLHELAAGRGDVRLVIIDPLARCSAVATTAVKTVNTELMNPLRNMARKTGCAVVLVHHETKAGTVAGGQALYDSARSLLRIDKDDDGVRSVRVEKANMARDQAEPVRYRLTGSSWADTRVEWLGEDAQAAREGTPAENRILMALASSAKGLTLQKIASMTGLPYDSVRVLTTRLKGKGLAVNAQRGVWTVNGERVRVINEQQHQAEQDAGKRAQAAGPRLMPEPSHGYGMIAAGGES